MLRIVAACAGCSCRASNPAMRARSEAYLNHRPPSRANRSAAASFWAPLLVIETLVARRMVGRTAWAGWRAARCGYNTSKPMAVRSLCFANYFVCFLWGFCMPLCFSGISWRPRVLLAARLWHSPPLSLSPYPGMRVSPCVSMCPFLLGHQKVGCSNLL